MAAGGWSWDPASVLGDSSRLNSIRPPTQNVTNSPRSTSSIPPPSVAGWGDENIAPLQGQAPGGKPAAARSTASKKRKSDVQDPPKDAPEINDDDSRLAQERIDLDCDQVRQEVRRLLEAGEVKVGEFQRAIGVGAASYYAFMNADGANAGSKSSVYYNAWKFLKKRELRGADVPPSPKRAKATAGSTATSAAKPTTKSAAKSTTKSKSKEAAGSGPLDVGDVTLHGEDTGTVPVYDTCDDVRKKIRAVLRKSDVTQAAFLRAVGQCFPGGRKIQGKQLNDFLSKRGPVAGNTSAVFYGGYVFFEKIRIKQDKPKTEKRLQMEREWRDGVETKRNLNGPILMMKDEVAHVDQYGKLQIHRRR